MPPNRPYRFELAAMALAEPGQHGEIETLAERNGVDPDKFERATVIINGLKASGETLEDFVRREYILDGWLQGYLPLDVSPADSSLTTWKLGQFAEAYYRS